jgi:hypothetical protein
MKYFANHNCIL